MAVSDDHEQYGEHAHRDGDDCGPDFHLDSNRLQLLGIPRRLSVQRQRLDQQRVRLHNVDLRLVGLERCAFDHDAGGQRLPERAASWLKSTVAPNPSPTPRSGTLTIAGRTLTVNQGAAACSFTVTPTEIDVAKSGGAVTLTV